MTTQTYLSEGADIRAAEIFNRMVHENLVDLTDLTPTAIFLGDLGGSGSDTLTVPTVTWDDPFAAANTNETSAASTTDIDVGSFSLSVAHQILAYKFSEKLIITGAPGNLSWDSAAEKMAAAYVQRFTDQLCGLIDDFSNVVGSTTVDLTVDDIYSALYTMIQNFVPGPWFCALYTVQFTDFMEDLRGELGAVQFREDTSRMLALSAPGFKGSWLNVDFVALDSVVTANAGADSAGAMWGRGAIGYAIAQPRPGMFPGMIPSARQARSPVYVELDRETNQGGITVVGHAFNAVTEIEDARGVSIITDR